MANKANLLGKRKAEDGLKTEPLLRRHKEKETRQGLADSTLKGTAEELSETKADESNLISEKEEETVEERLDETPEIFFFMTDNFLFFPCSIDFFKDVGQVVRVRLLLNARGKHLGYGFVEFASSNQAKMALERKNRQSLHCSKIILDEAPDFVEEAAVPIKTLFIASFPRYSTEISDIIDFFKDVGQVVRVRLEINDRGKFVGCGFVDFASANQANKALQNKNGEYLHDRKIFLADGSGATFLPHKFCIDHKVCINFFKDVGEVVHVRLIVDRWGNLQGKGFVEFASANEAMKALEKKNGEYLNGSDVFLAVFETPPYHRRPKYFIDHKVWYQDYLQRESLEIKEDVAAVEKGLDETPHFTEEIVRKKTVFVDGLSYNTRISDIINFFKDVREEIIRVRFIVDGRGDHVGCCFVEMATANAAKKAVQENYNTSKFFVYAAEIAAQCPFQPKYKLADLAEKLWYEDSLRQKSLCGQKLKPILNENKVMEYDKKIILDEAPDFVEEAAVPIRTLFIASLSRHSTDISDIIDFFKDVGQVVRVRLDINDRGKLVGCGYVEFASANQANKVLYRPQDVGEVVHVRLIVFRWGNLHGKGFVEFASANEAMKALEKKNGEYLNGRDVFLAYFETPPYHRRPKYFIDHKVW
ncbi:hypothetical protein BRARA_A00938 [Brassica rapa]|uniref:RRM domain-containing protein n=1 Tax=Brassica campestris TaxID=3711 RepID=A0A398AMV1_BRACM|nr:hypothetical protein BRARA_A00938 [Brassica rapa]